jgi:hypothetical protein
MIPNSRPYEYHWCDLSLCLGVIEIEQKVMAQLLFWQVNWPKINFHHAFV